MKVVMNTTYCGPKGHCRPGDVIDLPSEEAEQLLSGGYAKKFVPPKPEKKAVEEAVVEEKETPTTRSKAKPSTKKVIPNKLTKASDEAEED